MNALVRVDWRYIGLFLIGLLFWPMVVVATIGIALIALWLVNAALPLVLIVLAMMPLTWFAIKFEKVYRDE